MCYILRYSKYILVPILTDWLGLEEFGHLNTALTNRSDFVKFLAICTEFSANFQNAHLRKSVVLPLTISFVNWINKRAMIPTSTVELSKRSFEDIQSVIPKKPSIIASLRFWKSKSDSDTDENLRIIAYLKLIKTLKVSVEFLEKDAQFISFVLASCEALEELIVSKCEFLSTEASILFTNCPNIRNLRLLDINGYSNAVLPVLRGCPSLEELHADSSFENEHTLIAAIVSCRRLRCLNVTLANNTNIRSVTRFYHLLAFHSGARFTQLTCLRASSLVLKTLLWYRGGPQLMKLRLSMRGGSLKDAAVNAARVTDFTLVNANCVTVATVTKLTQAFRGLKALRFESCFDYDAEGVSLLLRTKQCTELDIGRNEKINDSVFTNMHRVSGLVALNINYCNQITDRALLPLSEYCPALRRLNISGCTMITDTGLLPLLARGGLMELNISYSSLTEASVAAIAQHCYDLRDLTMYQLAPHTSPAMDAVVGIVHRCRRLRFLRCDFAEESASYQGIKLTQDLLEMLVSRTNPKLELTLHRTRNRPIQFDRMK